jgi:hypothetical protein
MAIATATALTLAGIAGTAGTQVVSSALQSRAAGKAADKQTQAANRAAELQSGSTREALDFEKQQSALEQQRSEADRRANYDQWLAREQRLGSLGQMVGLGQRTIPGYVPSTQTAPGSTSTTPGGGGMNDPRVADVFNRVTQGLAPTSQNLDVVIKALNDAGVSASRATHAGNQPSEDFINFGGGGGYDFIQNVGSPNAKWQMLAGRGAAPARAAVGSLGQMASASPMGAPMTAPLTAPIQAQQTAYRAPSRLRDYLRSA